jgi:hypothetical protein
MNRHPANKKPILNKPFCVDDFGNFVFKCQYTDKPVSVDEMIFLGPCIPQLNGTYVCHPTSQNAYKEFKQIFDESEANCNTCKHLVRKKHTPRKDKALLGSCYKNANLVFHPEDCLNMLCYEQREKI